MDTDIVLLLHQPMRDVLRKYTVCLCLLFIFSNAAATRSPVKTLPGYSGTLPFKLETGYVNIGEREDVELFYYFIESERNPATDPLMLWLTGGPGCSGFSSLAFEIGPLKFDAEAFDGLSLPKLILNPYSWTKIANIIFLDAPVGAGFSYATTPEGYYSSDTQVAVDIFEFLQKWLVEHPEFIKNRLYVSGESYSGKWLPVVTSLIVQSIEEGVTPHMNLQMAKDHCRGEYRSPDPKNAPCLEALQLYEMCTDRINFFNVLEPDCKSKSDPTWSILPQPSRCLTGIGNAISAAWMNDPSVPQALHVRNGTKPEWKRCNGSVWFDENVDSAVQYHRLLLSKKGLNSLVYSGDHDMLVPYIGTLEWIGLLNLTIVDDWRPWFVNNQIAGYTERYVNSESQSHLTFVTVKGAGHTAPEYKPEECFPMIHRFLESSPL